MTIRTDQLTPLLRINGTDQPLLLDCNYEYEQHETAGLTVKWFWDKDHEPAYQWIPGEVPKVRGILKVKPSMYVIHNLKRIRGETNN